MNKVDLNPLLGTMSIPGYNITLELTFDHIYLYPCPLSLNIL